MSLLRYLRFDRLVIQEEDVLEYDALVRVLNLWDEAVCTFRKRTRTLLQRLSGGESRWFPVVKGSPLNRLRLAEQSEDWLVAQHIDSLASLACSDSQIERWSLVSGLSHLEAYQLLQRIRRVEEERLRSEHDWSVVATGRLAELRRWLLSRILSRKGQHLSVMPGVLLAEQSSARQKDAEVYKQWSVSLAWHQERVVDDIIDGQGVVSATHYLEFAGAVLCWLDGAWLFVDSLQLRGWLFAGWLASWRRFLPWRRLMLDLCRMGSGQRMRGWLAVARLRRYLSGDEVTLGLALDRCLSWHMGEVYVLEGCRRSIWWYCFEEVQDVYRFSKGNVEAHVVAALSNISRLCAGDAWQSLTFKERAACLHTLRTWGSSVEAGGSARKLVQSVNLLREQVSTLLLNELKEVREAYCNSVWSQSEEAWRYWVSKLTILCRVMEVDATWPSKAGGERALLDFCRLEAVRLGVLREQGRPSAWNYGVLLGAEAQAADTGDEAYRRAYGVLSRVCMPTEAVSISEQELRKSVSTLATAPIHCISYISGVRSMVDATYIRPELGFALRLLLSDEQQRVLWRRWVGCCGEDGALNLDSCWELWSADWDDGVVGEADLLEVWHQQVDRAVESRDVERLQRWLGGVWPERFLSCEDEVARLAEKICQDWEPAVVIELLAKPLPGGLGDWLTAMYWIHLLGQVNERAEQQQWILFKRFSQVDMEQVSERCWAWLLASWERWKHELKHTTLVKPEKLRVYRPWLQFLRQSRLAIRLEALSPEGGVSLESLAGCCSLGVAEQAHLDALIAIFSRREDEQLAQVTCSIIESLSVSRDRRFFDALVDRLEEQAKALLRSRHEDWFQLRWSLFLSRCCQPLLRLRRAWYGVAEEKPFAEALSCIIFNQHRLSTISVHALKKSDKKAIKCVEILSGWQVLSEDEKVLLRSRAIEIEESDGASAFRLGYRR